MALGLVPLRYIKNWFNKNFTDEQNWDEIADKTAAWALRTHNNLIQLGIDIGGDTYQYNNNGSKTQAASILDRLDANEAAQEFSGTRNLALDISTPSVVKIVAADGSNLSTTNKGLVTINSAVVPGELVTYEVTANVSITLTGAHWGQDTLGDLNDAILRLYAIDTGSSIVFGVGVRGFRNNIQTASCTTTPASANTNAFALTNSTVASNNSLLEIAWFKADFDDTGNAGGENFWTIQNAIGDINFGDDVDSEAWMVDLNGNRVLWSGMDINVYSDTGTTIKFSVDGATGKTTVTAADGGDDPVFSSVITGGQTWTWGSDNSDSDVWKLQRASALTTDHLLKANQNGVGSDNYLEALNGDNSSLLSRAYMGSTVGGASGGDPLYIWTVSGATTWAAGIDNSSSDRWRLQKASALTDDYLLNAQQSGAGSQNYLEIFNSNNSAASDAYFGSQVGGTSAGDPLFVWSVIGGDSWAAGIDNSDSDAWKLQKGGALSADYMLRVSQGGSGADNAFSIYNSNNTASSNAICQITVGGTSSNDPFTVYTVVGGTAWYTGIDNSDSDNFKIGTGSTVGSSTTLTMNSSGEVLLLAVDPPTANYINRNSAVKSWADYSVTGATTAALNDSYNVSSISCSSWDATLNWNTDYANSNYAIGHTGGGNITYIVGTISRGTSSCAFRAITASTAVELDGNHSILVIAAGDQ